MERRIQGGLSPPDTLEVVAAPVDTAPVGTGQASPYSANNY